eukprot:Skav225811  [mRNA]  locus=scaffold4730:30294:31641:- [translate_table: standard]
MLLVVVGGTCASTSRVFEWQQEVEERRSRQLGLQSSIERCTQERHETVCRSSVLFEVRPSGQLAVFDFTQLLLQLTTSLTLLALATVTWQSVNGDGSIVPKLNIVMIGISGS